MNAAENKSTDIEIMRVIDFASLNMELRDSAVETYRHAFAEPPYNENFTASEAEDTLSVLAEGRGDLLLGILDEQAISFAGGYTRPDGVYLIQELAVAPQYQGRGYGRRTLRALLDAASEREPERLEVRTTSGNRRAITLYESEGFVLEGPPEAVAQRRQGGGIAVDNRIYLSRPELDREEIPTKLRRAVIAYPSGNTTALVFDQLLSINRKLLNDSIMNSWRSSNPTSPEIEQCCFIAPPKDASAVARVEMFGGEFCGNATRCAAWTICGGESYSGLIEVSGAREALHFRIEDGTVTVEMPLPELSNLARSVNEGTLVHLDGIVQLVVTDSNVRQRQTPRLLLGALLEGNKYALTNQPAVGVTYYDPETCEAQFCVWVKDVETIFDETACGSGTCAIGVAIATRTEGSQTLSVIQPSSEVIVTGAEFDSATRRVSRSAISGGITILYDGEFELS